MIIWLLDKWLGLDRKKQRQIQKDALHRKDVREWNEAVRTRPETSRKHQQPGQPPL